MPDVPPASGRDAVAAGQAWLTLYLLELRPTRNGGTTPCASPEPASSCGRSHGPLNLRTLTIDVEYGVALLCVGCPVDLLKPARHIQNLGDGEEGERARPAPRVCTAVAGSPCDTNPALRAALSAAVRASGAAAGVPCCRSTAHAHPGLPGELRDGVVHVGPAWISPGPGLVGATFSVSSATTRDKQRRRYWCSIGS